jgi:tripartite-type tricarboxylate transporter receptor subunit TctC
VTSNLHFSRRAFLASAVALAAPVGAQGNYPDRTIKIIIPIQPGGIADTTARIVAERLSTSLGQPVIIDNRPGGNYLIALGAAASAPPDGYTLLGFPAGVVATQAALRKFDLLKSFVPIAMTGDLANVIAVGGGGPYKTMKDLVEFGKANPGKIYYGTPGTGALEHLKALEFEKAAGITGVPVPLKGGPDMVMSLIRGDTQFAVVPLGLAAPYAAKGQIRFIAVVADERNPVIPNVPSLRDLHLDMKPMFTWMGLAAPKGTPETVVRRIHSEVNKVMQQADVRARLSTFNVRPSTSSSSQEFEAMIRDDLRLYSNIVASASLKIE